MTDRLAQMFDALGTVPVRHNGKALYALAALTATPYAFSIP
jgi:hypothetical protein